MEEFTVKIDSAGDVYINGKLFAKHCKSAEALGKAIENWWLNNEYEKFRQKAGEQKEIDRLKCDLVEATVLLKYCVNYYERPMTAAISGQLGEKVKEFIKRQEG